MNFFSTRAANLLFFFVLLSSALSCLSVRSPISNLHQNLQQFQEQAKQVEPLYDPLFIEKHPNFLPSKFFSSSSSSKRPNEFLAENLPNCTQQYTCAQLDDPCNGDFATRSCKNQSSGLCCAPNLHCQNGTCITDNIGSSCTTNSDCLPPYDGSLITQCLNGTCIEKYSTGDYCKTNTDCISGSCDSDSERCIGIPKGNACPPYNILGYSFGEACESGTFCLGIAIGVCTPTIGEGGFCVGYGCASGLTCVDGTCQKMFSVPDQGNCDAGDLPIECQSNSACYSCGLSGGTCLPGSSYTMHSCDEDSDCVSNSCVCSPCTGKSYCELPSTANNCNEELEDLFDCMNKNNCTGLPNNAPMSCTRKNCRASYISYSVCQCYQERIINGQCYYETYCSKITLWLIIGIVVGIVVLACLIGCCIFICCKIRKRRSYNSV